MRRTAFAVAVTFVALGTPLRVSAADAGSDEAMAAFARGEYVRAADILEARFAVAPFSDPAGSFLMGLMYDNGLGVAANGVRACASYLHSLPAPALGPSVDLLVRRVQQSLSERQFKECMTVSAIGFDHRFEGGTFVLEPGHWVAADLVDGATVFHDGMSAESEDLALAPPGVLFFPIVHTELSTGPLRSTRRHFLEVASWIPGQDGVHWTLLWRVYAVRQLRLDMVAAVELATASSRPTTVDRADVANVARLRVADDGDVEWVVSSGPNRGRGRIH